MLVFNTSVYFDLVKTFIKHLLISGWCVSSNVGATGNERYADTVSFCGLRQETDSMSIQINCWWQCVGFCLCACHSKTTDNADSSHPTPPPHTPSENRPVHWCFALPCCLHVQWTLEEIVLPLIFHIDPTLPRAHTHAVMAAVLPRR